MRRLLLALSLSAGLASGAFAQSAEIEANIAAQMQAFKADDFATAFTFASPNIQRLFGNPDNFGAMVRNGYPMVWRPADVRFLELREIAGSLWQKVMITDGNGLVHILDYQMVPLESGWKINGVQLLSNSDPAV
ncbi:MULTISPECIES: DUF4864 domain-containing protein [unclassified Ruegeria]|uniref:DUF4864 domain-containing protein n=1 Tax=unclassified Ruegeria TaxID=2625375 RepID=UPI001488D2A8|nr:MULTISPECIES: DUF4864 domain-containing protein [unclassified Ruegeria]NOD35055.1 DUF4864 domain-containing protein [Ruegeria sp. HKCCD7296]NOD47865.1 DUF4864 domain-containing protein [Ruegeria sp. HKCCD5849]NOD52849.1 DUF4864 domain-containing protein [Ruegeria sp. HKCCD5851]NOD68995.1 DUF4864 domain-containing protein [Ruegeria sp. HKCCD7303]NOE35308.1 DUF4864 domain-containing protein [Ruegeria sp. HKCCD7318]